MIPLNGKRIPQRSDTDCSICCTAMALNLSYEDVRAHVPDDKGWNGLRYDEVFEALGYDVIAQPRLVDMKKPAIFSVPSRLKADGFHAVYYEAGVIYDPSVKAMQYNLFNVVRNYIHAYQWNPLS